MVTREAYDALGRRISKNSEPGNTTFYWNGDVLLGEVSNQLNSNSDCPSRTYLFEPFSFKPLALVQNNEVFHYHTDHIGTPREITNARAEVVWSSTFKTYGALALAHANEVDNPLRFQGQYYDSETGLHYNRHRYYDPNCGQFTTQDPIGLLGGMNAYQYAPNPMTWVDPWGLTSKEDYEDGANRGVELEEGAFSLIGANRAVIDPRKLTEYALNPAHPVGGNKARVFESALGFTKNNADDLMGQLRKGVMNNTPIAGKVDQFGSRFTVDIPVTGPAGSGIVRSRWIYKPGSNMPEMTTIFVK